MKLLPDYKLAYLYMLAINRLARHLMYLANRNADKPEEVRFWDVMHSMAMDYQSVYMDRRYAKLVDGLYAEVEEAGAKEEVEC